MTYDPAFVWNRPARPTSAPTRPRSRPAQTDPPLDPAQERTEDAETPIDAGSAPPTEDAERDAVLVPLDQWSRILNQLGNLHEAGQQLAEARERAAKAETESTFLRERLRDMRGRVAELEQAAAVAPEPAPEPGFVEWFLRRRLESRKRR